MLHLSNMMNAVRYGILKIAVYLIWPKEVRLSMIASHSSVGGKDDNHDLLTCNNIM